MEQKAESQKVESQKVESKQRGWVLYDGACGFCRRWAPFWGGTLRKRGFAIAPLQSDWVRERVEISQEELIHDLRLLLPDGRQVLGADVYRHVMKRIWWAWPVYLFAVAPLLRNVFDWSYRTFANNRYWVSSTCRLPGAGVEGTGGGVVGGSGSRIESSQPGESDE